MRRISTQPRRNWQERVERVGLTFHSNGGAPYWDESAYYELTAGEVDEIERATNTLHSLCLDAVQHVIDAHRYAELAIPAAAVPLIEQSWESDAPSIYGRFDFTFDRERRPKLLEYNADTPTSLLEAAVAQWYWLQDVHPSLNQFNSIHERLVAGWHDLAPHLRGRPLHFASLDDPEDRMTATYLQDTAMQAGIETNSLSIHDIGYDRRRSAFVDLQERSMSSVFKLYPWEWMLHEEFGAKLLEVPVQWIEPSWKMVLSNKAILAILWELFPDCPYLLATSCAEESMHGQHYVRKPLLSREGANIAIYERDRRSYATDGDYGAEGYVYQAFAPLPDFDGQRPVIGSWVVAQESAGIGIRESNGPITDNASRFVPHVLC